MAIMVRNIKLLPNGKYLFRRAWPEDVRRAMRDLPREFKRTFQAGLTEREAALKAAECNAEFDERVELARSGRLGNLNEEQLHASVSEWFAERRKTLDNVIWEDTVEDPRHGLIEVEETQRSLEIDAIVEAAAAQFGVDAYGRPKQLNKEQKLKLEALNCNKVPALEMTISRAISYYVEHQRGGIATQSEKSALKHAIDFFGDLPIAEITRRDANRWAQHLAGSCKHSASTVSKRVGTLKATLNLLLDHGIVEGDNPFARLKVPVAARSNVKRKPFHKIHLEAIERYFEVSSVKAETIDVVRLLMFTGCRPGEIAGLKAEDISLGGPIPFLYVRWTEDARLKNKQSTRRVPLVGFALDAAKRSLERRSSGFLFPTLAPAEGSSRENNNLSARVNKCIRAAGIYKSDTLVTYSFRHTMAAALDLTESVNEFTRERFIGHAKKDDYGSRELPLERALAALEAALANLGHIDTIEYTAEELTIAS